MRRVARRLLLAACLPAAGALAACGGQGLVLEVEPATIEADGVTVVELVASVTFRGGFVADGRDVTFDAGVPVLFASLEDVEPRVAGGRAQGDSVLEVGTQGGVARAFLLAPTTAGSIDITASHTTVNRDVLSDTQTLTVQAPPAVAAGTGACGATGSQLSYLDLRCERANIGAFVTARPEIRVPCQLTALDASGRPLPHTPVELFAEAGSFLDEAAVDDEPRRITYVVPPVPSILPRDVAPMAGETSQALVIAGSQLIPGADEQNPRDGLVTLLVVARGHEAFTDDNGNGRFDPDECYQDEGEPFLDVDDDGVYSAAIDGPHCCDVDGNGRWDGPNGQFDADRPVGRLSHILWTGPVFQDPYRSGITTQTADFSIAATGQKTLKLRVVDAHFNPVAALDDGDDITFDVDGAPVQFLSPVDPDISLAHTSGLFTLGYPYVLFDGQQVVFDRLADDCPDGLCGRDWVFSISDTRSPTGSTIDNCYTWSVTADVRYTPVDASGFAALETQISVNGRLENLADDCP